MASKFQEATALTSEQDLMEQAQKILPEYIACSGGGAKGSIYSGVYEALAKLGALNYVKGVAGSSAGSFAASMIAFGVDPKEFEKISKETNLESLLGKKGVSAGPLHINKDGKPLYDLIDKTIRSSVLDYLKEHNELSAELKELQERCKKNGKIYFKDLALLRKENPERFKDLVITAVRKDNGELTIFDTINTPDIEVALACKASASIPIVFESTEINGIKYVDGGYRDNIPMKYFPENKAELEEGNVAEEKDFTDAAKKTERVFALAFGSDMDASANIAIYSAKKFESPGEFVKFIVDVLFKMLARVGGKFKYTETDLDTQGQLRDNALNTVVLNTQGVSTLDFKDAQKYSEYLHIKGYCQTTEYLDNHVLTKPIDPTFENQKFLLKVYEIYENKNLNKTFGQKLLENIIPEKETKSHWLDKIENHDDKAKALLSFCKPDKLLFTELAPTLEQHIIIAATARKNELKTDTKAMQALINGLNDPTTPNKIKKDYIELLNINDKDRLVNIKEFKFIEKDFSALLAKNKNAGFKIENQFKESNKER